MVGDDSVLIPRSPEEVFDVLADGEQNPRWRSQVVRSTRIHGSGAAGTEWQMELRGWGRPRLREYVVEEFERPRRFAIRFVGGRVRGTAAYVLSDDDGGTMVSLHLRCRGAGVLGALGGAVARQMASDLDDLGRLRSHLAGGAQEAAASSG
ncbi:MAG: SRPBCC family protein [Candidatus Dormibacteria bacterium]